MNASVFCHGLQPFLPPFLLHNFSISCNVHVESYFTGFSEHRYETCTNVFDCVNPDKYLSDLRFAQPKDECSNCLSVVTI
jgi:hypothetical protein